MGMALVILGLFLAGTASAADHLVISQVQITGGPGKTTNDFVEIYNPTALDLDLQGLRLVKRTKTGTTDTLLKSWTDSTLIKARGYYLWANSGFVEISTVPDATTTGSLAADNGVAIRSGPNDTGTVIDSVAWGEAANAFVEGLVFGSNPEANQSLERKPGGGSGNDQDSNDNSQDFFLQSLAHPRNSQSLLAQPPPAEEEEGEEAQPPPASGSGLERFEVSFSEILPNPEGRDSGQEWVEFYNAGSNDVNLADWYLDDDTIGEGIGSNAWRLPLGTVVKARSYLVLQIPRGKFALNNTGGEAVRLFDEHKVLRLEAAYQEQAKEGWSFARQESSGQWLWSELLTPGEANAFVAPAVYPATLRISEVLPNPEGDDGEGEFVEIYNFGTEDLDLADWVVADSRKRYVIFEDDFFDTVIPAEGYFVLYREVTGISLNNTGEEEVKLFDPSGGLVDEVGFDARSREAQSYAWQNGEAYDWTLSITAGEDNEFVLPEEEAAGERTRARAQKAAAEVMDATLHDIRALELGITVRTSGVVVVEPGILGAEVVYLGGSGLRILFDEASGLKLQPGDEIELLGKLSMYHGELQLRVVGAQNVKLIGPGRQIAPQDISTGEVGESREGFLVKVQGLITRSAGDTFFLDDGSGEARIYIRGSTGIEKPPTKKGQEAEIVGIVSQFDEHYRIMPRYQTDLLVGSALPPDAPEAGQVAGISAPGALPRTGSNIWLVFASLLLTCYITFAIFAYDKPKGLP